MLVLHGLSTKSVATAIINARMSCLLTGIELFPGNISRRFRYARRLGERHFHRPGNQKLFSKPRRYENAFRLLEFGVGVSDRADPWTRMSYGGPNKPDRAYL